MKKHRRDKLRLCFLVYAPWARYNAGLACVAEFYAKSFLKSVQYFLYFIIF
jgi:hypothetical protein